MKKLTIGTPFTWISDSRRLASTLALAGFAVEDPHIRTDDRFTVDGIFHF